MAKTTGSGTKIGPTLAVIGLVIAAGAYFGGKGTGRPAREDTEEHIVVQAEFTRGPRPILVMVTAEGVPIIPEGTVIEKSPWTHDFWIPKGASVAMNVWQETTGTVSCNISSNGAIVNANATMDSPASARCYHNRKR